MTNDKPPAPQTYECGSADAYEKKLTDLRRQLAALTEERDELQANEHKMNGALSAKQEQLAALEAEKERLIGVVDIEIERKAVLMAENERLEKELAALRSEINNDARVIGLTLECRRYREALEKIAKMHGLEAVPAGIARKALEE